MGVFDELPAISPHVVWDGVVARVVAGERLTLAVIELGPGTVVPEHSHENEQAGVLVAGSVRFRIGEEECELRPGGTWCVPPGVPHEVVTGPDGATVVEVFVPARDDWSALERIEPSRPAWP